MIKNLVLDINQKGSGAHINFFMNCEQKGILNIPRSMRQMFEKMKRPQLQIVSQL